MTDQDKLLALKEKLGAVEWEDGKCTWRVTFDEGIWHRWRTHPHQKGWSLCTDAVTDHEAECLLIREAYRQLREKWTTLHVIITSRSVCIDTSGYGGLNNWQVGHYTGPTELDAVLATVEGEL